MSNVISRSITTITSVEIRLRCGSFINISMSGDYDPEYFDDNKILEFLIKKIRGFSVWDDSLDLRCKGKEPGTLTRYITTPITSEISAILDDAEDNEDMNAIRKVLELIV